MIAETISARNDWRVKKKIALSPQTALWSISMESPKSYHLPPWRQGCIAKKHLDLERQIIEPDTLHSILRWARIASKHVNVNNGKRHFSQCKFESLRWKIGAKYFCVCPGKLIWKWNIFHQSLPILVCDRSKNSLVPTWHWFRTKDDQQRSKSGVDNIPEKLHT